MGSRDGVFWNGVGWVAGVFTVLGLMLGFAYFGTAEARAHGRALTAAPEYLECEEYLNAVGVLNRHEVVLYCLALHQGQRPDLAWSCALERRHPRARLPEGRVKLVPEAFQVRYLDWGPQQIPPGVRPFYPEFFGAGRKDE